jgi:putative oxidoreductase
MLPYIKKMLNNSWLELAVRWFLGMVFLYASYHKIVSPAHFAKIIYGYYLFPDIFINIIAIVLPFLELFSGLALILGIYPRTAAVIIDGMLMGFIIALSINLIRGQQFDCGCFSFGEGGHTYTVGQVLVRDIVFFVLGLQVILFDNYRRGCLRQSGNIFRTISS